MYNRPNQYAGLQAGKRRRFDESEDLRDEDADRYERGAPVRVKREDERNGGYRDRNEGGDGGYNRDGGFRRDDRGGGGYNRNEGGGTGGGYNRDGGYMRDDSGGGYNRNEGGASSTSRDNTYGRDYGQRDDRYRRDGGNTRDNHGGFNRGARQDRDNGGGDRSLARRSSSSTAAPPGGSNSANSAEAERLKLEVEKLFRMPPLLPMTSDQKKELRTMKYALAAVCTSIQDALRLPNASHIETLYERIQELAFQECWARLIEDHPLWRKDLKRLLSTTAAETGIPDFIRLDARVIVKRWSRGDFDPHLLRGFLHESDTTSSGNLTFRRKRDPNYKHFISCNNPGTNGLEVGQWWPFQNCAVRDGAHGEIEAGIHGSEEHGALSVVISGGGDEKGKYEDDDLGNIVFYCGTRSKEGAERPTRGTQYLLDAELSRKPVRLLRSSKAHGNYKPSVGIRYDGLYKITGSIILDERTNHHRFTLERCEGQHPIRHEGAGMKPDKLELRMLEKDVKERKGGKRRA